MWTITNFTLEELTDPALSGEDADFESDGLQNFVEYAFLRHPKMVEPDSPMRTTVAFNPVDGLDHVTLTYERRMEPTDVRYEVRVSDDLITWHAGSSYVEEVQAITTNGITETVTARLLAPWPSGADQFITIRVWLPSTGP
jgi:hypothetical protein